MDAPPVSVAALAPVAEALASARANAVVDGKRAFDAGNTKKARQFAERLDQVAEAEAALQHLVDLLSRLDLKDLAELTPPSEPVLLPPDVGISGRRRGGPRLADGPAHQPSDYYDVILAELSKHPNAVPLRSLWAAMEPVVTPWLNVSDHGVLPNHSKKRWQYVVQWSLTQLKEQGKVENPRRGYWKLRRA